MALWAYDTNSHRYRVTQEGARELGRRAGTYIGERQMVAVRDQWVTAAKARTDALASQYARGTLNLQQWQAGMRQEICVNFVNEYMLGRGGRNNMTPGDWGRIGQRVQVQYRYLESFAAEISTGRLSDAQIAARARMYVEASSQAYERGNAAARGAPDLPHYPGDGSTQCRSNCKCHWRITETETEWRCYWQISPVENCGDCLTRAGQWNPLVIAKQPAQTREVERAR